MTSYRDRNSTAWKKYPPSSSVALNAAAAFDSPSRGTISSLSCVQPETAAAAYQVSYDIEH